jgi:GTP-binding protein EngB required for normal cell division
MKLSDLIKSMVKSIIPSLCFFSFAFGMEDNREDQVNYQSVKTIMERHLANNQGLLDSSKDKDIVVFLGNTGAGKSTLINYLSEKELRADDFNNIVLSNPHDSSAMAIGEGAPSETFLPRFIPIDNLLFYDMPGFKATQGTAIDLVNACFIKNIIENANSVRLVFVVGMGEINDGRGESFKNLSNQVRQLISDKPIENFSGLVVTKSHVSKTALPHFVDSKLELNNPNLSIVLHWINHQKIDQVSLPRDGQINYENRGSILNIIREMGHEQIEDINIGITYGVNQQMEIKAIYDAEIESIIEKLQNFDVNALSSLDAGALENKKTYMMNDFNHCVSLALEESTLIKLLRPISEGIYQSSWNAKSEILLFQVEKFIGQIDFVLAQQQAAAVLAQQQAAAVLLAQQQAALAQQRQKDAEEDAARLRNAAPSNEFARFGQFVSKLW